MVVAIAVIVVVVVSVSVAGMVDGRVRAIVEFTGVIAVNHTYMSYRKKDFQYL